MMSLFPTGILLWLSICAVQVLAFKIEIEPYKTDRPAPGDTLFYNIVIEQGDPKVVDFILYNGDLDNSTIIFEDMRLVGDQDASGYDIPFVPPGKKYTGRLGRVKTRGREVLIESDPFEIWPVGGPNAAGPSGGSSTTPTSTISVSIATQTKLITILPSSTTPAPAPTGGAFKIVTGTSGLLFCAAIPVFLVWI
ncbi:hypothetical protein BJ165DRAFT_1510719 [Panaeolus papilionaceus]|nr:hypothetical protein BJ165DRAFT_1510719 [Panaeolus papilionaceus]